MKVVLLDVNYLLYSGHYATPLTCRGVAIGGAYTTVKFMINCLNKYDLVIACLDSGMSIRKDSDQFYKANRKKNKEIGEQRDAFIAIAEALGVPVVKKIGYEADDVIASISKRLVERDRYIEIDICTADKDLYSCVTSDSFSYKVRIIDRKYNQMDQQAVIAKLGVAPYQVEDYLAIVGDTADNVKGIKGCGKKTAAEILDFAGLDYIIENPHKLPEKLRKKLFKDEDAIKKLVRNLELTTLYSNLEFADNEISMSEKNLTAVYDLFEYYGFKSLMNLV